jgi:hypothetical protein
MSKADEPQWLDTVPLHRPPLAHAGPPAADEALVIGLRRHAGRWRIHLDHGGQRATLAGLPELIRYLQRLDSQPPPTARGLR